MKKEREFNDVIRILPERIRDVFENIPENMRDDTAEIRLRIDKPVIFYGGYGALFALECTGTSRIYSQNCMTVSRDDIDATLARASGFSLYSHFDELSNGFLTLPGGHRIGVGVSAANNGESFRDVESLNIRLSRIKRGCSERICQRIFSGNKIDSFLIAGPPGSGKTTVLRDIICTLSLNSAYSYPRIAVADERYELSTGDDCDNYICCDIIKGYTKSRAFGMALRSLSPDIVITDELTEEDAESAEKLLGCGVRIGASVHAENEEDLMNKRGMEELIGSGKIDNIVFLSSKKEPGKVVKIIKKGVEI